MDLPDDEFVENLKVKLTELKQTEVDIVSENYD